MGHYVKGILYILVSALFFGSYGVWSRWSQGFGDFNQAWVRAVIILILIVPVAIFKTRFPVVERSDWKWFALISLAGGLNQAPYYFAFRELEIGTATLLFYASLTISGFVLGTFFFGEVMGLRKCVALFFALAGMGTIFSFSIHLYDVWPAFCAILAGIMGGAEVVFTKKISNRYSALQILVFVFVTMAVCNGIISLFIGEKLPPLLMVTSWYAQIGYALSMLAAMYCVVKGFKHVQPAVGSILGTAEIVFAVLLGHFFFHEVVGVVTYIGIVAIISSVLLTSVQRNPRQE